jgi:uncharacterized protein YacL
LYILFKLKRKQPVIIGLLEFVMQVSVSFIRAFFAVLCLLFFTAYTTTFMAEGVSLTNVVAGLIAGGVFSLLLVGLEVLLQGANLRTFNTMTLGLLFGYLMGEAVMLLLNGALLMGEAPLAPAIEALVRLVAFMLATYFALVLTFKASDELHLCVPFVKLKPSNQKKKCLLIDTSALFDTRIIDLAGSGLLDHLLVLPKFVVKELNQMGEQLDEANKARSRKGVDSIKKLESIPSLDLQYTDVDFPDLKDPFMKLTRLAAVLNGDIITADLNRIQQTAVAGGLRIINIHALANALKPITQSGEFLSIKIQRYGKEARQGIGYLDDGTMVVVNGGAEFIGDTIKAQVLSVKHTSSGRMIFCNTAEEQLLHAQQLAHNGMLDGLDAGPKSYLTL